MENLLDRINNAVNDAHERSEWLFTVQLLFTGADTPLGFDVGLGVYSADSTTNTRGDHEERIRAHFEFAKHFSLKVLFVTLDTQTGTTHQYSTLNTSTDDWAGCEEQIMTFLRAKVRSCGYVRDYEKFNNEWKSAFNGGAK